MLTVTVGERSLVKDCMVFHRIYMVLLLFEVSKVYGHACFWFFFFCSVWGFTLLLIPMLFLMAKTMYSTVLIQYHYLYLYHFIDLFSATNTQI